MFSGAGVNAAAAASGAGATASSSDHHVTARGSALFSAEMMISCAAPARDSAPRRHGQLGAAGTDSGLAGPAVLATGEGPAGGVFLGLPRPLRERHGRTTRPPSLPAP